MASVPSNEVMLGDPIIPVDQSIYEPSTAQRAPVGTRLKLTERTFYYCQASASVGAGTILGAAAPVASAQSGIFAVAATSAGSTVISGTSSAAVAANFYAEGYFGISTGAAVGELYKIKSNAAGSAGFSITLYDGLNTTITSGTNFYLMPNPYKNSLSTGSQNLLVPLGVAPTAVTSGAYFWLQTWGIANPIHEAASAAGAALRFGTTGGLVATFNATTNDATTVSAEVIAKNISLAATAGQANPVFLHIRP